MLDEPIAMTTTSTTIVLPFRAADLRAPGPALVASVREIAETLPIAFRCIDNEHGVGPYETTVHILSKWEEHPHARLFRGKKRQQLINTVPMVVEVQAQVDLEVMRSHTQEGFGGLSEADLEGLALSVVESDAVCTIADVLLAAMIARPATFDTYAAGSGQGESVEHLALRFSLNTTCRDLADKYHWPPISDLPVRRVYSWLRRIDGFSESFGRGPLGRAVAAFSYVLSGSHQTEGAIVWPLIGLEALYGRGKDGLERQIFEKSELFLGPRREFKKKFREIYDTRSRFVHGTVDMPLVYSLFDAAPEYEQFHDQFSAVTDLAVAVLVASLQRLALEDRVDLEFQYQRVSEPRPPQCGKAV